MQSKSHFFDDLSKMFGSATGVAQGMRTEMETFFKGHAEKLLKDMDVVTREEFEAVREMAIKAREENELLKSRLDALTLPEEKAKSSDG